MKKLLLILTIGWSVIQLFGQEQKTEPYNEIQNLILLNEYNQAYKLVCNQVELNPEEYAYWFQKGLIEKQILKQKESQTSFEKALELNPGNLLIYHQLSSSYLEAQAYDRCLACCDSILAQSPGNLIAQIRKAQAFQKDNRIVEAISSYMKLYEQDSINNYIMRQIGSLYSKLDSVDQSLSWYRKAIHSDSTDLAAYQNLGSLLVRAEQYEDGVNELTRGIDIHPEDPWLYRFRGSLNIMGADFEEAEDDFRHALSCGDSTAFIYRHLGLSLFKQSRYSEALPIYQQTIKRDPEDPQAWFYLGYCYKWQVQVDSAIQCMEKSLSLSVSESLPSVYSGLAEFYALKRNYDLAIHNYSRAYEWNPDNPTPLAQIGMLVEQSGGKKEHAKTYYQSFLKKAGPEQINLLNYVNQRLDIINEKLFMEGKLEH